MSHKTTILLVEDEPVVREAMVQLLDHAGCRVFDTFNAADALDLLTDHPEIPLLITDIRMAGMSGIDLAREAQIKRPDLQVILTSGNASLQTTEPYYFLPKPWRAKDLIEILDKA